LQRLSASCAIANEDSTGRSKWAEVQIEHQSNNYGQADEKTVFAWERKVAFEWEQKQAEFLEIWIRKGNKTSPALSND